MNWDHFLTLSLKFTSFIVLNNFSYLILSKALGEGFLAILIVLKFASPAALIFVNISS